MIISKQRYHLVFMLTSLTILAIIAQVSLFLIHYKVSDLIDSLIQSSIKFQIVHPAILVPIFEFISIQIASYILYITWIWFISVSLGELFHLKKHSTYCLGLIFWLLASCFIITFNNYYFSNSFFSQLLNENTFLTDPYNYRILLASITILLLATLIAYVHYFWHKRHLISGSLFLFLGILSLAIFCYDKYILNTSHYSNSHTQPNIILIGLDSLRPDFVHSLGNQQIKTPYIDTFLQSSTLFTQAYSPLARTFPAWMSILTAKYPKHSHARSNLADPTLILQNDNLAKRLQQAGYKTIYGTDEKRFSNITEQYGFDEIIGPHMGIADFILGGLSDFPLTNLLINTPIGQWLFPYNYANRAAAITYEPNAFLQLVEAALSKKQSKPLFLCIHLCLTHWPYTWAHDKQKNTFTLADRYESSVEAIDQQFNDLMILLKKNGLLDNSIVILLSDHGTTLGLPNDRIISKQTFEGKIDQLNWISQFKLDFKNTYTINTSYGQGTDVLSLKQYHVLLALKDFRKKNLFRSIDTAVSLLDISPTLLDMLQLPPLQNIDGLSLKDYLSHPNQKTISSRALFLESAYTITEIETNDIFIDKVLNKTIGAYSINPDNGFLFMKPEAEKSIIHNKQRAILLGDWLLAQYPDTTRTKLMFDSTKNNIGNLQRYTLPAYFVLVNLRTGKWTIGLDNPLAQKAPAKELLARFHAFYSNDT